MYYVMVAVVSIPCLAVLGLMSVALVKQALQ